MEARMLMFKLMLLVLWLMVSVVDAQERKPPTVVHRRTEFTIAVHSPYDTVFPLFGAHREQLWAEGWNPQFLHPQPANDESGAVFTVTGGHSKVWINTIYDAERGHVQYACFAESMVTLINIQVSRQTPDTTKTVVIYERTALRPESNEQVNRIADDDGAQASEWEEAISAYLHPKSK